MRDCPEYSHNESFYNLFGTGELTEDEYNSSNIINYISEKTPPTFIMHSSNDELVNVKNSLMLADKFAENNIKFEMHIYYDAPHGVALANKLTWIDNPKYDNNSIYKSHVPVTIEINTVQDLSKLGAFMKHNNLKVNKSEIARALNINRRTVTKYLNGFQKCTHRNKPSRLDDPDEYT